MNEQEVLKAITEGETAYELLLDKLPKIDRKWDKLIRDMRAFLKLAQTAFPDAQYYTAGGGFTLMLGNSHSEERGEPPQQELIALYSIGLNVGDGDF